MCIYNGYWKDVLSVWHCVSDDCAQKITSVRKRQKKSQQLPRVNSTFHLWWISSQGQLRRSAQGSTQQGHSTAATMMQLPCICQHETLQAYPPMQTRISKKYHINEVP